jgi:diketogulonate reductase-like aldo/keto reductase
MKLTIEDKIKLNNDVLMPQHGFGVYLIDEPSTAITSINKALEVGYRSFDTAQFYENEDLLGEILQNGPVKRKDLFITTKITNEMQGYNKTLSSFEKSLNDLKLTQLDLLLVHWPSESHFFDTWLAFERLYDEKLVRAIGVCNFQINHLEKLKTKANIIPAVNQIERHPYLTQYPLKEYLDKHNIALEAWSPLGRGAVLKDNILDGIAESYKKSVAQVILRWHLQQGTIIIPKSSTPSRIAENADIYDFFLSIEDMEKIDKLNRDHRTGPNPDEVYLSI